MNKQLIMAFFTFASFFSASMQSPSSPLAMRVRDAVAVDANLGAGFTIPVIGEHAFYLQVAANGNVDQKIIRLSLSGEKTMAADLAKLSLGSGIRPEEIAVQDYAENSSGGVDVLLRREVTKDNKYEMRTVVARFDSDGDLGHITEVPTAFHPSHFVPFPGGSFWLIVGYPLNTAARSDPTPTAMILNEQGQLSPTRLSKLESESTAKASPSADEKEGKKLNAIDAASLMQLATGDRNDVYAYTLFSPNSVDRITSNGEVENIKLTLPPVADYQKIRPIAMLVRNRQLVFHFGIVRRDAPPTGGFAFSRYLFPIYSLDDHELKKTFVVDAKTGHGLVGYSPDNLYFLSGVPNKEKNAVSYTISDMVPE